MSNIPNIIRAARDIATQCHCALTTFTPAIKAKEGGALGVFPRSRIVRLVTVDEDFFNIEMVTKFETRKCMEIKNNANVSVLWKADHRPASEPGGWVLAMGTATVQTETGSQFDDKLWEGLTADAIEYPGACKPQKEQVGDWRTPAKIVIKVMRLEIQDYKAGITNTDSAGGEDKWRPVCLELCNPLKWAKVEQSYM